MNELKEELNDIRKVIGFYENLIIKYPYCANLSLSLLFWREREKVFIKKNNLELKESEKTI